MTSLPILLQSQKITGVEQKKPEIKKILTLFTPQCPVKFTIVRVKAHFTGVAPR
jgi:hypothetical protein